MEEHLLEIKDLCVNYTTDENVVYAINGLNLTLDRGKTLGLVGETGAGKTTTALSIMRLLPDKVGKVTGGSITLDGIDIMNISEAEMRKLRGETVSVIFQDPMTSLNPLIPIGDQIEEVLVLHRPDMDKEEREAHVDRMMEMIGLPPERKNEYPHQFSGGMKQRIVIAMALACEPKLLLADEPTTALDVTIQAQVLEMMKDLKRKLNTSIVLITHDLGVVAQTCDQVAIMYAGEIIEQGTVQDIFEKEQHHPYTVGLFNSIPDLSSTAKRLKPIMGLMPDPTDPPKGCRFHERCKYCMPICEQEDPAYWEENGHTIKCHLFPEQQ